MKVPCFMFYFSISRKIHCLLGFILWKTLRANFGGRHVQDLLRLRNANPSETLRRLSGTKIIKLGFLV